MNKTFKIFCIGCCGVVVVTLIIMILFSFSSLEINEFGLNYSGISKTIQPTVFTSGIHFLGVGHHFIKFPKTVQTIEFSSNYGATGPQLQSRTMDGLEVALVVSFQWKVIPAEIYQLYMTYSDQYQNMYQKSAIDFLTDSCTRYSAYEFFMNRTQIGAAMQQELNKFFNDQLHSTIEFFQLRSVDLPDEFENAIQDTEVSKQDIQKAYAEMNQTVVQLQTEVIQAQYQANVTVTLAKGIANQTVVQSEANAKSFVTVQDSQSKAYGSLGTALQLNNTELLHYIKSKLVRDRKSSGMVINLETPENEQ